MITNICEFFNFELFTLWWPINKIPLDDGCSFLSVPHIKNIDAIKIVNGLGYFNN